MGFLRDIAIAIVLTLLAGETQSYMPWLQRVILRIAVALLAASDRANRLEEWQSILLEYPGELTRTALVFGFLRAGFTLRAEKILRRLKVMCVTWIRLGVNDERLHKIYSADLRSVEEAITSGKITVKNLEVKSISDTSELVVFVYEGHIRLSTAWDRGQWWRMSFWTSSKSGNVRALEKYVRLADKYSNGDTHSA